MRDTSKDTVGLLLIPSKERERVRKREREIYIGEIYREKYKRQFWRLALKKNHVGISLSVYLIEGTHNFFLCGEGGTKKCKR